MPSRRTIGIRVPDHVVTASLLDDLGAPIMSSTLMLAGEERPLSDPRDIRARLEQQVDAIIDSGTGGLVPTTIVDLVGDAPRIVRAGKGIVAGVEAIPQAT